MPHVSDCVYVAIHEAYLGQCCSNIIYSIPSSIAFYHNVGMALELIILLWFYSILVDSNKEDKANLKLKVSVWNPRNLLPSWKLQLDFSVELEGALHMNTNRRYVNARALVADITIFNMLECM